MKESRLKPDNVTFLGLLTACTHAGLIEQGLKFFDSTKADYGITLDIEHHTCVVDLFCRSGRVKDAYESILGMEMVPNAVIWGTLLSASSTHLDVELAECCLTKLLELEPENYRNYVLVSNLYASVGKWEEASKVRNLMKDRKLKKEVACSCIAVKNELHKFLVGDTSHPRWNEIFRIVNELAIHLTSADQDLTLDFEIS
ncbi:hypothetical protein TIFTF001_014864 [Ficus carica]|uniref:Pentatricopeptide repeat-containing protein n=1 Tax=Ficus carica TaxID=3494 RepID=A0AA88AGT4_FICCA|nr:hypothetical protein TIFTF001_014864 [Ficus carica]